MSTTLRGLTNIKVEVSGARGPRGPDGVSGTVTSVSGQAVSSTALLAAIPAPKDGQLAFLTGEPGGEYVWHSGDFRAQVASDPAHTIYIPPAGDISGQSGAWVLLSGSFPSNAYSIVSANYNGLRTAWLQNFYDPTYNSNAGRIKPTVGDGGQYNGQPYPGLTAPSAWQAAVALNWLYSDWQLQTGSEKTVKANWIAAEWAYFRASFSDASLKAGSGGICNTSDDTRLYLTLLKQVHEVLSALGKASEASYVLACLEEALWAGLARFHDPLQSKTSYGQTTPGGIACASDPFGVLYAAAADTGSVQTFGYVSSSNEYGFAVCALYLANKGVGTATSCNAYARNVWMWGKTYMRRGAPADATKSAEGLHFTTFNLDPNVANSGAITGAAQPNEIYHTGTNTYFGKPIRGMSAEYLGCTLLFGTLSALLYSADGDAKYLSEVKTIATAVPSDQGFGRTVYGVRMFCAARDPWSDGMDFPEFVRLGLSLIGVDTNNAFRSTLWNTAKSIIAQQARGYVGADWAGRELNPATGSFTWLDENVINYGGQDGGGQARPQQIMTSSMSMAVVASALMLPSAIIQFLGSGLSQRVSVEQLASDMAALQLGLESKLPLIGGTLVGNLSIGSGLSFYSNAGASGISFGNSYYTQFSKTTGRIEMYTGRADRPDWYVGGQGSGTFQRGPAYYDIDRDFNFYITRDGDGSPRINFASGSLLKVLTTGAFSYLVNNVKVQSVDSNGVAIFKGSVTPNGAPV